MNKISALDIRIAVFAHPFVFQEDRTYSPRILKPVAVYRGDERIVSLFQESPKPQRAFSSNRAHPILRKGQYALFKLLEILKQLLEEKTVSNLLAEISPPRTLLIPGLPHPPFKTVKPPRFFWHPAYTPTSEGYAPSCLMPDRKEELPSIVYNSSALCAFASKRLIQRGILRQDGQGFVYLELNDAFITVLSPFLAHSPISSPAHIPVVLPHEWSQRKGWGPIKELGLAISFQISRLSAVKTREWPGVEKVYFFCVQSADLEALRERLLLQSRIRGHDFHIAIACQRGELSADKELFRLNVSCFAA